MRGCIIGPRCQTVDRHPSSCETIEEMLDRERCHISQMAQSETLEKIDDIGVASPDGGQNTYRERSEKCCCCRSSTVHHHRPSTASRCSRRKSRREPTIGDTDTEASTDAHDICRRQRGHVSCRRRSLADDHHSICGQPCETLGQSIVTTDITRGSACCEQNRTWSLEIDEGNQLSDGTSNGFEPTNVSLRIVGNDDEMWTCPLSLASSLTWANPLSPSKRRTDSNTLRAQNCNGLIDVQYWTAAVSSVQDSCCHGPCRTVHHCTANEPGIAHDL